MRMKDPSQLDKKDRKEEKIKIRKQENIFLYFCAKSHVEGICTNEVRGAAATYILCDFFFFVSLSLYDTK